MEKKKEYIDKAEVEVLNEKKKEYNRLNKAFEADAYRFENLEKKKKEIEKVVKRLKNEQTNIVSQKEFQIKVLKEKSVELRKKKEETEKRLSESRSKLDEYRKEYPNHEIEKAKIAEE